jgi:hypothetical protein
VWHQLVRVSIVTRYGADLLKNYDVVSSHVFDVVCEPSDESWTPYNVQLGRGSDVRDDQTMHQLGNACEASQKANNTKQINDLFVVQL